MGHALFDLLVGTVMVAVGLYGIAIARGIVQGSRDFRKIARWRQKYGMFVQAGGIVAVVVGAIRVAMALL